jgi:hypothetical protein
MTSLRATKAHFIALLTTLILFSSGCASIYHPANVNEFTFNAPVNVDNTLSVVYRSGVQKLTKNRNYDLAENKKKMRTVALRIQNISDRAVKLTPDNFKIHSPAGEKKIIHPESYTKQVHQNQKGYLVVGAVGAIIGLNVPVENRLETMTPAVIMVGSLAWGLVNFSRAINANRANRGTLEFYEIWGRELAPRQTIEGIVIIPAGEEDKLTFSFNANAEESPRVLTYDSLTLRKMNQLRPQVDYVVVPITGTSYTVHGAIQTTGTRDYLVKPDGSKIDPEDTKSIVWTRHEKHVTGIPHDGRWIFKVITGKVNAYRYEVEAKSAIDFIQEGDGEILPYKPRTLAAMANDDPEIIALVKKGKVIDAMKKINPAVTPAQAKFDSVASLQRANQLSPQFDYVIVPTSGTSYNLRASIKTTGTHDYMEKKDGSRLNPEDTKTIVFVKDGERVTGVPYDGRWIFKVVSGKINAYSYEHERKPEIEFIQLADGEIVRYDPDKLSEMAGQDAEVVGLIEAGKVADAIRIYNERVGGRQ